MINVKANFASSEERILNEEAFYCNLCDQKKEDNQKHLFQCKTLKEEIVDLSSTKLKYEDIYSKDIQKLQKISNLLGKVLKKRTTLLLT